MKRYERYKPSGIEWIGKIPERWEINKLKYVSKIENGSTPNTGVAEYWDGEFKWATPVDVSNAENYLISDTGKRITKEGLDSCGTTLVEPNSIILTTRAPIGNVAVAGDFICTNQGCKAIHLIKTNHRYLFYQLLLSKSVLESLGSGSTFKELSTDSLKSFLVCLPSTNEQTTIAEYLDRKTTQIDDLIAKEQKLIDLLNEEKTAIIGHLVTKGLNPNVPMKDSGIPWLGKVPERWEVKKLKYVARLQSGDGITSDLIKQDGPYPVFGGNGLRGYTTSYTHEGDYVLIGRQGALCGNINYATGRFWASEHAIVATPCVTYVWLWFGELLRTMNLNQYSQSAAQPGLAVERIQSLLIPVPPIEDQRVIADLIETSTKTTEAIISKVGKEISLLQEYRTALISEAVTGKIDVRGFTSEQENG